MELATPGFAASKLVLDETVTAANPHHSMEPRSSPSPAGGQPSSSRLDPEQSFIMRPRGLMGSQLVYIGGFCGGGFGSRAAPTVMTVPAHMAKINRPCMLRIRAGISSLGCRVPGR
jgi:hypothetical protein